MSGTIQIGTTGGQTLFSTSGVGGNGTPATGYGSLYYGSDNQLRLIDDAGIITDFVGSDGNSGSSGNSGSNGLNGSSGTSGSQGSAGAGGSSGLSGSSGSSGNIGSSGSRGSSGSSGEDNVYWTHGGGNITSNTASAAVGGGPALFANTTGFNNVALGTQALENNTTGSNNVAIGREALRESTNRTNNIGIGFEAAPTGALVSFPNIAIGANANFNTLSGVTYSGNNIAIGFESLYGSATGAGSDNIAIGTQALRSNGPVGLAGQAVLNIAIGHRALFTSTGGGNNIAIGAQAGQSLTTGKGNIIIGRLLDPLLTGSNNIFIGGTSGATAGMTGALMLRNGSTGNTSIPIHSSFIQGPSAYTSNRYLPFTIGGTTYKLLLST
jgi:hypothetical protein